MKNSSMSAFTRGSQIFLHTIRMMGQGTKAAIRVGLVLVLLLLLVEIFFIIKFGKDDLYYTGMYVWCYVKLGFGEWFYPASEIGLSVDGRLVSAESYEAWFLRGPTYYKCLRFYAWLIGPAITQIITCFVGGFIGTYLFFVMRGRKHLQKEKIRGGDLVTPKELKKMLTKEKKASPITIGGLPLVKDSERQHILVTGTTGAGKTNLLHELLPQIRARKEKAIIVDLNGTFVSAYYDKDQDYILNPFDARSVGWNPWLELEKDWEADALAASFIGESSTHDPFWDQSAKQVLAEGFKQTDSLDELIAVLTTHNESDYAKFFATTPVASLTSLAADKTAQSIRANINNKIQGLKYLRSEDMMFSLKYWAKDTTRSSWVFLTAQPDMRETMRPLISVWLDIALKGLMTRDVSEGVANLWFILDELPALKKTPSLKTALAEGRKYGGCIVAGVQNIHQLKEIYGNNGANSLLDLFNTRFIFRVGDEETARFSSNLLGKQEIKEQEEQLSYGANTMRDGVNINTQERSKSLVLSTEIMHLKDLSAFVKLQGHWPITKLNMSYKKARNANKPFIQKSE